MTSSTSSSTAIRAKDDYQPRSGMFTRNDGKAMQAVLLAFTGFSAAFLSGVAGVILGDRRFLVASGALVVGGVCLCRYAARITGNLK